MAEISADPVRPQSAGPTEAPVVPQPATAGGNAGGVAHAVDFRFEFDANAGMFIPEGGSSEFTSNVILKLIPMIKPLMSKRLGLMPQLANWTKTAIADPERSRTVNRTFVGLVFYGKPVDGEDVTLQIADSFNYFFGVDMNAPESKSWMSHELGNYFEISIGGKKIPVKADVHNWTIWGADVKLAGGKDASELGFVAGFTLAVKPFYALSTPVIKDLEIYGRFREWWWNVTPEGAASKWRDWPEVTAGIRFGADLGGF